MRDLVLWKTVADLQKQIEPEDELIIVDQNIPPLVPPPERAGSQFRLIHQNKPSLTMARNLGIESAQHNHLVFLDDDIVPDPHLLASFRRVAEENPNCIITGIVDQADKVENIPTPGFINLKTGEIRTNFSRPYTGEVPFFPGGLALIPRNCLPKKPYFCPSFRGASQGEEIDFALRVRAAGNRMVADPRIRIFHLKVMEGGCRAPHFRKRFFLDQVYNQGLFFGRHGQLSSLLSCLRRLKGFIEFHTRNPGSRSHSLAMLARASVRLVFGLVSGIGQRFSLSGI